MPDSPPAQPANAAAAICSGAARCRNARRVCPRYDARSGSSCARARPQRVRSAAEVFKPRQRRGPRGVSRVSSSRLRRRVTWRPRGSRAPLPQPLLNRCTVLLRLRRWGRERRGQPGAPTCRPRRRSSPTPRCLPRSGREAASCCPTSAACACRAGAWRRRSGRSWAATTCTGACALSRLRALPLTPRLRAARRRALTRAGCPRCCLGRRWS